MSKFKTLQFNKLAFIPLLLGILAVYMRQIANHDFVGILFLVGALIFTIWYYLINLPKCLETVNFSTAFIGCVIDILAVNFFIVNFSIVLGLISPFASVCYVLLFVLLFSVKVFFVIKKVKVLKSGKNTEEIIFVTICLLLSILPNIEIFQTWFRWDSYIYLFDFYKLTPLSVFTNGGLRVAQHVTFSYSLFAILLQSLLHADMKYVVLIINVLIMFSEMLVWNALIKRYASSINKYLRMLFSIVFAFSPYVFGMLYTINLEQVMLFGVLLFFLAETKNDAYLIVFAAFITCNSKETGTVLVICMMLAYVIKQVATCLKNKKKGERINAIICECDWLIYCAVLVLGILWFYDFITSKWSAYNATLPLDTVDGCSFNKVSFSFVFILSKLKSLLFVNFNWLLILIILSLSIYIFVKSKDKKSRLFSFIDKFAVPIACFLGQFAFSLVFVTYNHFRYWQVVIATIYLLFVYVVEKINVKRLIKFSIAFVIGVLFVFQNFFVVDPLMRVSHATLSTGKNIIVSSKDDVLGRTEPIFTDSVCNNRQIFNFDKALDLAIASVDYDVGCSIAYSAEFVTPSVGGDIGSLYMITGFGYEYMDVIRYVAWDKVNNRRRLTYNKDEAMQFLYVTAEMDWEIILNNYGKIFYIEMPFETEIEKIKELPGITVTKEKQIDYKGWNLNVYKIG